MDFCMNCGKELPPEAGFCPKCGTKVDIPVCPSCGKEIDPDDGFCLYCGARLREEEPAPEAEVEAPQPEPKKGAPCVAEEPKPAQEHPPEPDPLEKWTGATNWRWQTRIGFASHPVSVTLKQKELEVIEGSTCADIPLKSIYRIRRCTHASAFLWVFLTTAIVFSILLMALPEEFIFGMGTDQRLYLAASILGGSLLLLWRLWYSVRHDYLTVSWLSDTNGGEKETNITGCNKATRDEIQTALTTVTQANAGMPKSATGKIVASVVAGVCLAVALIFVAKAAREPSRPGQASVPASQSYTSQPTPKPTPTPTQEPASYYYVDELLGYWEDTVYDVPGPSSLSFEEDGSGEIMVTFTMWMSDSLSGLLQVDEEGDIYVDMVSMFSETGEPSYRLYLFYDGYGLTAYAADSANEEPYYFVR